MATRLLQRSNHDLIEYKNQIFRNNNYAHLRACDSASSYHLPSPVTASKIPKLEFILNCCSDYTRMNALYSESSEQLDCFFPKPLHQIKFHIFQNISKCSIHILRPFKYNNMCELCDNIPDKDSRDRIIVKFFLFFTRKL